MEFRIGVHLGDVAVEGERIYGDSVNIAARLEALAEPGGICISGTVHDVIKNKLDLDCEDLGEQEVKNIPEPVRAYRVGIDAGRAATGVQPRRAQRTALVAALLVALGVGTWWLWSLYAGRSPSPGGEIGAIPGDEAFTVPGFGSAPAIAVLPFENLSGDPEQEYFADGIADDLITRLSTVGWGYPIIARNSSFVYKGQAVDVKQVSRELGVRYVVEGSVRKVGERVRISAQLIDAATGAHVWAETYDRELRDIFAVQDEITQAVVSSINPALLEAEAARVVRKEPRNLDAYDLGTRGWWHLYKLTEEENAKARPLFKRAIELDPQSSWSFVGLAWTYWNDTAFQWTDMPAEADLELMRAARRGAELDAHSAPAQLMLCLAYLRAERPEEMIAAAERAVELDPSFAPAHAWLGGFLASHGRLEEGLASAEKAIRLSPRDPLLWFYFHRLANVHFHARRYEDAVEWARRSIRRNPRFPYSRATLAAAYAHFGRLDDARAEVEELLRVQPGFSLAFVRERSVSDPEYRDHYLDGLHKAGLKE
jgi:adenylate cyclase